MALDIQKNISLKDKTWLKVGGPAEYLLLPKSEEDLSEAFAWARKNELEITVLGEGSNVLVNDQGIKGLVLLLSDWNQIDTQVDENKIQLICEAGAQKFEAMRIFLKHKLAPALFLSGLPGNIAGGVFMNAGVSEDRVPREFCEIVEWVDVMRPSGDVERVHGDQIEWSYRKSEGWQPGIIVRTALSWPIDPIADMPQQVRAANKLRLSKQPLEFPSCGSVFRNPEGDSSGRLIESCGLKGFSVGGAKVSEKHANFIINFDNAKASDVEAVIQHVKKTVKKETGIELQEEVIRL